MSTSSSSHDKKRVTFQALRDTPELYSTRINVYCSGAFGGNHAFHKKHPRWQLGYFLKSVWAGEIEENASTRTFRQTSGVWTAHKTIRRSLREKSSLDPRLSIPVEFSSNPPKGDRVEYRLYTAILEITNGYARAECPCRAHIPDLKIEALFPVLDKLQLRPTRNIDIKALVLECS